MSRPGRMRHRLTIQTPSITTSDSGADSITWNDGDTVYADIQPLRGQEAIIAKQVNAEISHRIWLRYRTDLKTNYQLKEGTRIFAISSILNPDERDHWLEVMAIERAAN